MWRIPEALAAPRLLPLHAVGMAATTAAVLLGIWQLQAWQAQRDTAARDLSTLAPVPIQQVIHRDEPFPAAAVGRPVALAGSWLPDATFYVTDRELDGRAGLWVVTPVAVCEQVADCDRASALLVVRGWAPDPAAVPEPPRGPVELTGWLQPPEGSGRPDPDPGDDRLPELRIADAIQRVDQDLYGAYLVSDRADPADAVEGLDPVTPESVPAPASDTGLRNLLYGVQWWVFAGFAVFLWWRWAKDEVDRERRSRHGTEAAPAAPARDRP